MIDGMAKVLGSEVLARVEITVADNWADKVQ